MKGKACYNLGGLSKCFSFWDKQKEKAEKSVKPAPKKAAERKEKSEWKEGSGYWQ